MKKILTFLLPLAALGGGIAGGEILRPSTESGNTEIASSTEGKQQPADDARADQAGGEKDAKADASASSGYGDSGGNDEKTEGRGWFTFPSQFFVPLMRNGDMGAMMIVLLQAADTIEAIRLRARRLAVVRRGKVIAQSDPAITRLSLEGRPEIVDPAAYAPGQ